MRKTMLIDGIEVTEDMELAMGDAVVKVPFFTSAQDMENAAQESDPDRNPDGTFKVGCSQAITKQTAKSLQVKSVASRKAKKVLRAREALLEEAKAACPPDYDLETWQDAWGLFTGELVHDGLDSDRSLRARVAVYKAIGKATDAFPDKTPLSLRDGKQAISGQRDDVLALLLAAREAKENE